MIVPTQLSIDPAYPGYRDDWPAVSADLVISIDGVEQKNVIAYDQGSGRLVRYETGSTGKIILRGEDASVEIVEGRVAVVRRHSA